MQESDQISEAEVGDQRPEVGSQRWEDGWQTTYDRAQRTEGS
jgi:hypothetical protein